MSDCPVPVKTDVGQVDLELRLSDGTSEKIRFPNVPVRESLRNGHIKIIGYQFGAKFKLVFCAKYDRGLDLGFWEIDDQF